MIKTCTKHKQVPECASLLAFLIYNLTVKRSIDPSLLSEAGPTNGTRGFRWPPSWLASTVEFVRTRPMTKITLNHNPPPPLFQFYQPASPKENKNICSELNHGLRCVLLVSHAKYRALRGIQRCIDIIRRFQEVTVQSIKER